MDKKILYLRIGLWLFLAIILLTLVFLGFAPNGRKAYDYDFSKPDFFIGKLTPAERVMPIIASSQEIIGDPVYFSLKTLRHFDKAKLSVVMKNDSGYRVIESGMLFDSKLWQYKTEPLYNRHLHQLSKEWFSISENGLLFFQKENKFKSIDEFLKNPPPRNQIATYNYDFGEDNIISGYEPTEAYSKIRRSIRGSYQFYTYIKNEDLEYEFIFNDLNQAKGKDPIEIKIFKNNKDIYSKYLDDDGDSTDFGKKSGDRDAVIKIPGLKEGRYKISIISKDDIVTKSIQTKQQKISFINKVWVTESETDNFDSYTDSNLINIQTINPAKLQKFLINDAEYEIKETYRQYSFKGPKPVNHIALSKNDLILSGNGNFSFTKDQLINSDKKVDNSFDSNKTQAKYVIAKYDFPKEIGDGWFLAQADFDLGSAYQENGKNSFLISVPGLKAENKEKGVKIKSIKMELEGKNFWSKLKEIIKLKLL